jgi:hypothetical protein
VFGRLGSVAVKGKRDDTEVQIGHPIHRRANRPVKQGANQQQAEQSRKEMPALHQERLGAPDGAGQGGRPEPGERIKMNRTPVHEEQQPGNVQNEINQIHRAVSGVRCQVSRVRCRVSGARFPVTTPGRFNT